MNNNKGNDKALDTFEKNKDIPSFDSPSWAESAKEDLEDFIEEQGIYIRQ